MSKNQLTFSRWCREGHIPYYSVPYLLRPNMDLGYYDLIMLRNAKNLPDAKELQAITGRLAVFLSVQFIPMPPMGGIVRKFIKLLNLPGEEEEERKVEKCGENTNRVEKCEEDESEVKKWGEDANKV